MATKGLVQLPPDSTGKQVGTWIDSDGKHYHGFLLVDADGQPVDLNRLIRSVETLLLIAQDLQLRTFNATL